MFLTAAGSCVIDDLLVDLESHKPMATVEEGAEACGSVLPGILYGCELARRLEDELPSMVSQTHLLLLSCKEIAAAFEAVAQRLNHSRSPSPNHNFHPQQQPGRSSPSTPQQYQYSNSSFRSLPQQQQYLHPASLPPTPQEYQQYCYSSPPTPSHQPNYLYQHQSHSITPTSSSGAAAALLDIDCFGADEIDSQLLADVDLDFLNTDDFQSIDVVEAAHSPENGTQQHSCWSSEVTGCGWGSQACATVDATVDGLPSEACPVNQATVSMNPSSYDGAKVDMAVSGKTCPQTEGASRSRVSRKRKDTGEAAQTWTIQLPAPRTGDMEAPPEDGHAWRKYGHKDILNARFPRCYYRCIHKNCCDAKKQLQRLDHDPFTYEITYYGHHTCRGASHEQDQPAAAGNLQMVDPTVAPSPSNFYGQPAAMVHRKLP